MDEIEFRGEAELEILIRRDPGRLESGFVAPTDQERTLGRGRLDLLAIGALGMG